MKNWKTFSLFGKTILDDDSFKNLQEMIRTQNFGEPTQAFKGAVMHRQPEQMFKSAISDFASNYRGMADELIARSDELAPEEGRKAVELLKRCEILFGMSQTFSEVSEKFRLANVMGGKNYAATATARWRVLERELGLEPSVPERGRISVQHLQNHSFN